MKKENTNGKKGKGCLGVVGVAVALGVLGSCFSGAPDSTSEVSVSESSQVTTSNTNTESAESATEEWADVKALGLDNATMVSIYHDYEDAWESSPRRLI